MIFVMINLWNTYDKWNVENGSSVYFSEGGWIYIYLFIFVYNICYMK